MRITFDILAPRAANGDLWIAGRRVPPGATTIDLTPAEAAHDLRQGAIRPSPVGGAVAGERPAPPPMAGRSRRGRRNPF